MRQVNKYSLHEALTGDKGTIIVPEIEDDVLLRVKKFLIIKDNYLKNKK